MEGQKKVEILKILLWLGAAYHIPFPLVAMFCKDCVPPMADHFYGFNIVITPQIAWLLNPLATYMLAFGLMLGLAATDPIKHKKLIHLALIILLIRILQRVLFIGTASGEYISGEPVKVVFDFAVCTLYWICLVFMTKKATCDKCRG